MKKSIKITESQLNRVVKKILNEMSLNVGNTSVNTTKNKNRKINIYDDGTIGITNKVNPNLDVKIRLNVILPIVGETSINVTSIINKPDCIGGYVIKGKKGEKCTPNDIIDQIIEFADGKKNEITIIASPADIKATKLT